MKRLRTERIRAPRPSPHRERGAALVEFALTMTIFLTLVFGLIQFGFDYSNFIAVRNGTREAARMGVVNDLDNAPSCKINGVTVTPVANPTTKAQATDALVCKTKSRIGLNHTSTKVKIVVPPSADIGATLQVCASYPVSAVTSLVAPFVTTDRIVSSVSMRLEQTPEVQEFEETGATC